MVSMTNCPNFEKLIGHSDGGSGSISTPGAVTAPMTIEQKSVNGQGGPSTSPALSLRDIAITVPFKGGFIKVALSRETFGESLNEETAMVGTLGGEKATREENFEVAEYLLEQERNDNLTHAEAAILKIYQTKVVTDSEGGLYVVGGGVFNGHGWNGDGVPDGVVLVVFRSAENKK